MKRWIITIGFIIPITILIMVNMVVSQEEMTETPPPTVTATADLPTSTLPPMPSSTPTPLPPPATVTMSPIPVTPTDMPSPTPVEVEPTEPATLTATVPSSTETEINVPVIETALPITSTDAALLTPVEVEPTELPTLTVAPPQLTLIPTEVSPTSVQNTPSPSPIITLTALTLPYIATMDDGAPDWVGIGWNLNTNANRDPNTPGLGWSAVAAEAPAMLQLSHPIDLRNAINPVLSFNTIITDFASSAVIEVSLDGHNWTSLQSIPVTPEWATIMVDLQAFRGSETWLRFHWVGLPPVATSLPVETWFIDNVVIVDLEPSTVTPIPETTATVEPPFSPTPPVNPLPGFCQADVDRDGILSTTDLIIIGSSMHYNTTSEDEGWDADLDFNADGYINILDLQLVAQALGTVCASGT